MIFETIYEFIGEDEDMGYLKGREYPLQLARRTFTDRVIGTIVYGIPFSWKLVIVEPIVCPYDDFDQFFENWKYKRMSFKNEQD